MFRIHEVFDVELSMAAFYEAPTLAACAAAIDAARAQGLPPGPLVDKALVQVDGDRPVFDSGVVFQSPPICSQL